MNKLDDLAKRHRAAVADPPVVANVRQRVASSANRASVLPRTDSRGKARPTVSVRAVAKDRISSQMVSEARRSLVAQVRKALTL